MGFGIEITKPNKNNVKNNVSDIQLSSKYPFLKLDTQSKTSFVTVNLTIATEPPAPNGTTNFSTTTVLYSFAHGLGFTPKCWSFTTATSSVQSYFFGSHYIYYDSGLNNIILDISVDSLNVYISCIKFWKYDPIIAPYPGTIAGYAFKITVLCFVDKIQTV
jgi:hypothetical protein